MTDSAGQRIYNWAELDCIVDVAKKRGGLQRRRPINAWLGSNKALFPFCWHWAQRGFCIVDSKCHKIEQKVGQIHVYLFFVLCPFLLLSVSAWRKPAPEGCSRCLTIAPRGYHSSLRLYFSVSSPSSRRSQICTNHYYSWPTSVKLLIGAACICRPVHSPIITNQTPFMPCMDYGLMDYSITKGTAMAVCR